MSFEALTLCNKIQTGSSTAKLILLLIANLSDEQFQSYPSINYLSKSAECDERTVRRALKFLEEKKIVKVENRFVDGKQISNLYTILGVTKKIPLDSLAPAKLSGVGVTNMIPNTKENTQKNKYIEQYSPEFLEFWNIYPRKEAKYQAFLKFKQAIKIITFEDLIVATKNYRDSKLQTEIKFIKKPDTWLFQRGYSDELNKQNDNNKNILQG